MLKKTVTVLLIENNQLDVQVIQEMLAQEKSIQFKLECVDRLSRGLKRLKKGGIDVVLLDLCLPENKGLNMFSRVHTQAPQVAIVVQTTLADESTAVKALQKGAQDYLIKGSVNSDLLVRSFRYSIERKHTENALRESEKKFRKISENILEWIWEIDTNGKYTYSSSIVKKIVGYKPKEIIKKHFYYLFHLDGRKEMKKAAFKVLSKKQSFKGFISQNIHKNGKIVWLSTSGWPILDEKGSLIGFKGVNIDITKHKQVEEKIRQSDKKLRRTLKGVIHIIALTIKTRDFYLAVHQRRVTNLACAIAKELGFSKEKINGIHMAGIIHDLGKIGIPNEILTKNSRLTKSEFNIIKCHSRIGYRILKTIEFPWPVAQIVLQHHERLNGSGYPQGFSGKNILIEAKILAVADVIEAMSSHRPYRPPLGIDKALEEIFKNKGILYDPEAVDACIKLFREKEFKF
jgi:PAS domain S-box-containing protein